LLLKILSSSVTVFRTYNFKLKVNRIQL